MTDAGPADPDHLYTDLRLPEGPPDRPYVAVNMVSTVDGKIRIGTSPAAIGSPLDKRLLRRIRAAGDGLMHGAETLRLEDVRSRLPDSAAADRANRGLAPQPRPIAVTRSGRLPLERRYFAEAGARPIVVAPADLPAEARSRIEAVADLVAVGRGEPDLPAALRGLRREHGLRHVVLEGGPTLNFAMLAAGLVDELFWTVAPKIVGGPADLTMVEGAGFPAGTWRGLTLVSIHWHEDELFLRYRVAPV